MSQLFGNYPFIRDGYKLVQVPFLGMEHQSCIAYGDKFDDNAFGFDFIVMHETGHEWWGNRTSAADKADMWIHESFCTYAEALYVERISGQKAAEHYLLNQKKKIKNKSPVQGPDGVYFDGWADSDMYYKGTWMLHSLRAVIGNDSLWFSWLKSFGTHFGLAPIRTRDVVDYASSYFRLNLEPFFRQYLIATDWPQLEIKFENKAGKHWVAYRWGGVVAGFEYPVELVINGKALKISPKQNWAELETEFAQPTVHLDEGSFLAKIKLLKNQE